MSEASIDYHIIQKNEAYKERISEYSSEEEKLYALYKKVVLKEKNETPAKK